MPHVFVAPALTRAHVPATRDGTCTVAVDARTSRPQHQRLWLGETRQVDRPPAEIWVRAGLPGTTAIVTCTAAAATPVLVCVNPTVIWVLPSVVGVPLTTPVFDLGLVGALDKHGEPAFETAFSWRDLILIAGGLFLVWKATSEIHEHVSPDGTVHAEPNATAQTAKNFAAAIVQILMLDLVFSIDSILTAVGMTDYVPVMMVAVIVAVGLMMFASGPLADFIHKNPTVVMLALGFLLMIGMVLIADGFGVHVPKGYIYAAMAFSAVVEGLKMLSRRARKKAGGGGH